jgi:anhydro-N-acetylmuramic acid kinase
MHANLKKLFTAAQKQQRYIIGLMSGTSLDGLDIALCVFQGSGLETKVQLKHFETIEYYPKFKEEVKSIFSRKDADLQKVCLLNAYIGTLHGQMVNQCLDKWQIDKEEVDLIGSHGQTIFHAPKFLHQQEQYNNATLQIGDGDHLAVTTGITTISDFRQKHIAAGGEGAPLAVYGDYLIFSKKEEDRIMLNIGGIANFTFLPGSLEANQVFSTDTGTGNTLMDAVVQKHFPGKYFDKDAAIAIRGEVSQSLLQALKDHTFFTQDFPKTIGPELFNLSYLEKAQHASGTKDLKVEDIMATLNRFSADAICEAVTTTIGQGKPFSIYTSGGGMHNPLLLNNIKDGLPGCSFYTTSDLGIDPDAKEAILFALLANEAVCGGEVKLGGGRNKVPSVSMGKISFPL